MHIKQVRKGNISMDKKQKSEKRKRLKYKIRYKTVGIYTQKVLQFTVISTINKLERKKEYKKRKKETEKDRNIR